MVTINPGSIAKPFIITVVMTGVLSTLAATLFRAVVVYLVSNEGFHLQVHVGFGILFGIAIGLSSSFAMRPVTL
jgi:hypothetical protein